MSIVVGQRFQRIPSLQKDREAEYGKQARDAAQLLSRLRETRVETEKAAQEEIQRTRELQVEEFEKHPDVTKWRQSVQDAELKVKRWGFDVERRSQDLRETITGLEKKLGRKQEELGRVQGEMEGKRGEEGRLRSRISELEDQLRNLQDQLNQAKIDEEAYSHKISPIMSDHNRIQSEIERLKIQKLEVSRQWDELKSRESVLLSQQSNLVKEIESLRGQLSHWDNRRFEVGEQLRKALDLQTEAQEMLNQHQFHIQQVNMRRDALAQQVQNALTQRQRSGELFDEASVKIKGTESMMNSLESEFQPLKSRYDWIMEEISKLQTEANTIRDQFNEKQNAIDRHKFELGSMIPMREQAERDFNYAIDMHRQAEQWFNECVAEIAKENMKAKELEAKVSEAHHEIHTAKGLQNTLEEGLSSSKVSLENSERKLVDVQNEIGELNKKYGAGFTPEYFENEIRLRQTECDNIESAYKILLEKHRQKKGEREGFERNIGEIESKLRSLKSQIEISGPSTAFERLGSEISGLENEIAKCRSHLDETAGTNPYESQFNEVKSQFTEIERRVYSTWSSSTAPNRLINQLKREAEVVMRAEAALSLEKQQEAVYRDARSMTKYHISTKPVFDIDDEGKRALLKEHVVSHSPTEVATTVLRMCEQQHIHA